MALILASDGLAFSLRRSTAYDLYQTKAAEKDCKFIKAIL
jgi:hypothetical protein